MYRRDKRARSERSRAHLETTQHLTRVVCEAFSRMTSSVVRSREKNVARVSRMLLTVLSCTSSSVWLMLSVCSVHVHRSSVTRCRSASDHSVSHWIKSASSGWSSVHRGWNNAYRVDKVWAIASISAVNKLLLVLLYYILWISDKLYMRIDIVGNISGD